MSCCCPVCVCVPVVLTLKDFRCVVRQLCDLPQHSNQLVPFDRVEQRVRRLLIRRSLNSHWRQVTTSQHHRGQEKEQKREKGGRTSGKEDEKRKEKERVRSLGSVDE